MPARANLSGCLKSCCWSKEPLFGEAACFSWRSHHQLSGWTRIGSPCGIMYIRAARGSRSAIQSVVGYHVLDHLDTQADAAGRLHPAVDRLERCCNQLVLHRIAQRFDLEQTARGRGERHGQTGCADDRGGPGMSVRLSTSDLDALADLAEAGDALGSARVDADNVHGARAENAFVAG